MDGNMPYVTNLVNSIIGVSVLAMPFCMKQCGIVLGLGLLFCSAWLTYLSCSMLASSAFHKRKRTYEYLALCTLGPTGKFVVELSMIGLMLGTCIAFYVVIGDLSNGVLTKFINGADSHTLRTYTIVFTALCIALPLGMMKNLAVLGYFGFISLLFYLAFLVVVILNAVSNGLLRWEWWGEVNLWRPAGIFQCLPIFSLAYACQCQLFIVYGSLEDPHIRRIEDIVSYAIKFVTVVYMSVGFFGYTTYRDAIAGNLLVSFPSNLLLDFIKLGFALSVVLGFPLMISPCRQSIHTLFFAKPAGEGHQTNTYIPPFLFKSITLTIVISTMIVATVIPNVETILGLTGATMGSIICFIFPALIYEKALPNKTAGSIPKFVFVLGCLLLVVCTYSNLANTGQTLEPDPPIVHPKDAELPAVDSPVENNNEAKKDENDPVESQENKPPDGERGDEKNPEAVAEVENDSDHRHEPPNPVDDIHPEADDSKEVKDLEVEKKKASPDEVHIQLPVIPKNLEEEEKKDSSVVLQKDSPLQNLESPAEKELVVQALPPDLEAPVKMPAEDEAGRIAKAPKIPKESQEDPQVAPKDPVGSEMRGIQRVSPKIIKKDELPPRQEKPQPVQLDPQPQGPGAPSPGKPVEKEAQNDLDEKQDEQELIEKIKLQHDKQQQLLKEQEQLIKKLEEHKEKKEQAPAEDEGGQLPPGQIDHVVQQQQQQQQQVNRDSMQSPEEDEGVQPPPGSIHHVVQQQQQQVDRNSRRIGDGNNVPPVAQNLGNLGENKAINSKVEAPLGKMAAAGSVQRGRELLSDGNGAPLPPQDADPGAEKLYRRGEAPVAQKMVQEPLVGAVPQLKVLPKENGREDDLNVEKSIEDFIKDHRAARKQRDVEEQSIKFVDSQEDAILENYENLEVQKKDVKLKAEESEEGNHEDFEVRREQKAKELLQDSPQERESQLEEGKDADGKDMEECLASDVECWRAKSQSRDLKSINDGHEF